MPKNPSDLYAKLQTMLNVWSVLRPNKSFAGYTLQSFKTTAEPSIRARQAVAEAESNLKDAISGREDADVVTDNAMSRVVYAICADIDEGPDGQLYVGMGYTARSARRKRQGPRRAANAGKAAAAAPSVETKKEVTD